MGDLEGGRIRRDGRGWFGARRLRGMVSFIFLTLPVCPSANFTLDTAGAVWVSFAGCAAFLMSWMESTIEGPHCYIYE